MDKAMPSPAIMARGNREARMGSLESMYREALDGEARVRRAIEAMCLFWERLFTSRFPFPQ
jgi:hypothetical protein